MDYKDYQHEVVIPDAGLPFKLFAFEGSNGKYVREKHWHNAIEIFAVWDGKLDFILGTKKISISAGGFVIVNSNEVHSVVTTEPNKTVVVQIPPELFVDYFTDDQFIWFSHSSMENDHRVFVLLQEMFIIYNNNELANRFQVMSLFYELLYLLVTKYRKLNVKEEVLKNSNQLKKLSNITRYMMDHYDEEITLDGLGQEFNYSAAYLSRMFQKHAGINFKDYLLGIRLEHATRDLEKMDDTTIVDIALNNGFPNSKAFSNAFKEKYGEVPSVYRKRMLDNIGQ